MKFEVFRGCWCDAFTTFFNPSEFIKMNLTTAQMTSIGIALAAVYAAFKFAPNAQVKAAALGVGGVILAKQLPYIQDALA